MKRCWVIVLFLLNLCQAFGQSFQLVDKQDSYQSSISQTLRIPIRIRNTTDRAQFYIIRKVQADLGSTQKGYFCLEGNCLEPGMDKFSKRIEPGEILENLYYSLETGLITGQNSIQFEIFPQLSPVEAIEHNVNVIIDEKVAKVFIFQSKEITVNDIYPNPVFDHAFIDYKIHNEIMKAKLVIHNILGSALGEYAMPAFETKIKLQTEEMAAGVYFYTIYLNEEGVLTRKLVVRK